MESSAKFYVEPDFDTIEDVLKIFVNKINLTIIETYISKDNKVTGYNFRLNKKSFSELNKILSPIEFEYLRSFKYICPEQVLPFSFAFRLEEGKITGKTIYFYPRYLSNNNKIKATSISDKKELFDLSAKFSKQLNLNKSVFNELYEFLMLGAEFRGFGISLFEDKSAFNIYVKISTSNLKRFFRDKMSIGLISYETILVSLKIADNHIVGYRLYYKEDFGNPCCGWGEVLSS